MRRFLFLGLVCLVGCGDVGSSSSNSSVESNQVFNPDPINCQTDCSLNVQSGTISASQSCTGSTPFGVPIQSLDNCDTITEVAPILASQTEESA